MVGRNFQFCIAHRFKPIYVALLGTNLPVIGVHHGFGDYQRLSRKLFANCFRKRLALLGVSNASGMFDIAGTMWLVTVCFVYGLKSAWLPWVWPIFNQVFLMIYLSAWLRRSNALTGADWLKSRFGDGPGSLWCQGVVVLFAVVSAVGFVAYGFQGIGKFAAVFLPWDLSSDTYALIIFALTTLYVIKGGMYGVVMTELLQFILMTLAAVAVGVIAMQQVSPEQLAAVIPAGWDSLWFGWNLDLDWSAQLPAAASQAVCCWTAGA